MSNDTSKPDLSLAAGLVSITSFPIVAGSFFIVLFGSHSQHEYDALKAKFGRAALVGFFPQFDTLFTYAFTKDRSSSIFQPNEQVRVQPDPTNDLHGFIGALISAGGGPGMAFCARLLLDRLLTAPVRERAYAVLDRTYGSGSADSFERIFGAMVLDAAG